MAIHPIMPGTIVALVLVALAVCNAQSCPSAIHPLEGKRPKPSSKSVFDELNGDELYAVSKFLHARKELALVPYDKATPTDNVLFMAEMLAPPKEQVLAFLNNTGRKPMRKAFAVLILYKENPPKCMQVEVGPLPRPTYYKEILYPKMDTNISINSRPISAPEYDGFETLITEAMKELDPVLSEATGGWTYDSDTCGDKCLTWTDGGPRGSVKANRKVWAWMMKAVDGTYINPVGLQFYIDSTSIDYSQWRIVQFNWAGRIFNSTADILAWFKANNNTSAGFKIREMATPREKMFSTYEVRNRTTLRGRVPGATLYEPHGKRYTVEGKLVKWQGWSFRVGLRSSVGMRLFDIRYKGERVAYEISLQQAMAAYGGNPRTDPMQATTYYLDSAWGMGPKHYELIHGHDCPGIAIYFDFWHLYDSAMPFKNRNSICLFEMDVGTPMRRHIAADSDWAASMRQYSLVVRGISTVYNYDYTYDSIFYTDGTFESRVTPYGFLQGSMNIFNDDMDYGYKNSYSGGGTVHEHVWNWKVDLDIAGTNNSVQADHIKSVPIDTPWHETAKRQHSLKVERQMFETEEEAQIKIDMTKPSMIKMVNEKATNKWGAMRSYRIDVPKYNYNIHPETTFWRKSAKWMDHHMVFTVRKEDEPDVSTLFDQSTPAEAYIDFSSFTDGESIRGKDLVAWVTTGSWHIPVAEDAPNSPGTAHYTGFVLRPYNFFNEDEAMDTRETAIFRKRRDGQPWRQENNLLQATRRCTPTATNVPFYGVAEEFEADD